MGRASLRRIGINDQYISTMTSKQARTALVCHQVLDELRHEQEQERAWLQKATAGSTHIPVRTAVEGEVDGSS